MNAILRRKMWKAGFLNNVTSSEVNETVTETVVEVETKVEEAVVVEESAEQTKPKSRKTKKVLDTEE